ncbi:TrfB-related DNA-binding protein [Sulfuricella sp.]|uniref:TrfB-related DNA-binding protein n=1 Tax=Sulfuricella sp. TaxID=2099377 RepID=UPI0039C95BCC
MNQKNFDQAIQLTRLNEKMRDAARMVLVEGIAQAEVARRLGVSRQAVSTAVNKVARAANVCPCCGRKF